jgi:histidine triad (HIT) family protein
VDCVFCRIRDGQIPSVKLFEDERAFAIMDINPLNEGHALVIAKAHAPSLFEVADEDLMAAAWAAKRLALAIQRGLSPDGLNVLQANGAAANQSVPHFHFHVIPRWANDGKGLTWSLVKGNPEKIRAVADRIKAAW